MNSNAIHDEIRRTRDALVREFGGDLRQLGDQIRAVRRKLMEEREAGSCVVREAPPKK